MAEELSKTLNEALEIEKDALNDIAKGDTATGMMKTIIACKRRIAMLEKAYLDLDVEFEEFKRQAESQH